MPPAATSMSEATPRAGLQVTPLLPSEPPQLVPRMISLAGDGDALHVVGPRQQLGEEADAFFDGFDGAAEVLHRQDRRQMPLAVSFDLQQVLRFIR